MSNIQTYILKSIVAVLTVTMLFSCQDNFNEIQKLTFSKKMPAGEAKDMYLVYTDSGKVTSTLRTPLNKDYSNQKFPYMEFPEGLVLEFFDEKSNKSVVTADYGILYSETNLVDLNGNVVLKTHDGNILEAPQLYWNQDSEWVFTEGAFKMSNQDGVLMQGTGIDFNKDLSILNADKLHDSELPLNEEDK